MTYLCSYVFRGARWQFEITADNMSDAVDRLHAIKRYGVLDGELVAKIPVPSWWENLVAWWRQL